MINLLDTSRLFAKMNSGGSGDDRNKYNSPGGNPPRVQAFSQAAAWNKPPSLNTQPLSQFAAANAAVNHFHTVQPNLLTAIPTSILSNLDVRAFAPGPRPGDHLPLNPFTTVPRPQFGIPTFSSSFNSLPLIPPMFSNVPSMPHPPSRLVQQYPQNNFLPIQMQTVAVNLHDQVRPEQPASVPALKVEQDEQPSTSAAVKRVRVDKFQTEKKKAKIGGEVSSDDDDNDQRYGERRLAIVFESYGTIGSRPQTIGNRSIYVPNGLVGKFTKYSEDWMFEIHHGDVVMCKDNVERLVITWIIRNCGSGNAVTATETPKEAMERDKIGRTICNRVFRDAVEQRREEYASALALEQAKLDPNLCKVSNLQSLIKTLSCKRFAQGPLVFGLYHSVVQENLTK